MLPPSSNIIKYHSIICSTPPPLKFYFIVEKFPALLVMPNKVCCVLLWLDIPLINLRVYKQTKAAFCQFLGEECGRQKYVVSVWRNRVGVVVFTSQNSICDWFMIWHPIGPPSNTKAKVGGFSLAEVFFSCLLSCFDIKHDILFIFFLKGVFKSL